VKLLILGGTVFLGRSLTECAIERGHQVTLFNRGKHNPGLFPEVEKIRGDRANDLNLLDGRKWDAAIDTCGYVPRIVEMSARHLADSVEHYTFVSSLSVYPDGSYRSDGLDEAAPVIKLKDESVEEITGETYGGLKALCEAAAERAMPGRILSVRPGLIVGPHDPTDRYTYWPHRIAHGADVLAPGNPEQIVPIIDVRDLAEWMIRMAEERVTGVFNATDSPAMVQMLEACVEIAPPGTRLIWVDEGFLIEHEVEPWSELPVWMPAADAAKFDCRKAISQGLTFRPLADTARDTMEWDSGRDITGAYAECLKPERESELLALWSARAN